MSCTIKYGLNYYSITKDKLCLFCNTYVASII